jgi:cytochrome c oxidase assembly factor CtaG
MIRLQAKKADLELLQASQLTSRQPPLLVAVVIMLIMLVRSMAAVVVRASTVVRRSIIWITAVVVVVAAWVIPISWISVAVTICGITDAYSDSSYPD